MDSRELTCIGCPLGCQITVDMENGAVVRVTGNTCKIGDNYARREVISPMRIVTSSVALAGADAHSVHRVSVKTATDIPKNKIFEVMEEIRKAEVKAPVHIGDVVIANVAGTGVNVIATKNVQ